ncbi:hypothetical protein C0993_010546, partial [Termitomyces sp. T159_Od127]
LYCGFLDAIEVFDVSRPGSGTRLPTTPSRKSKDGLKGIISALAFVPSHTSDLYAAGSLSPTPSNTALFSSTQPEPVMFVSGAPRAGVTQVSAGVTSQAKLIRPKIQFNPAAPHLMYTAHRRHATIYAWDLRTHLDAPLAAYTLTHAALTNQKIKFDVDLGGRWLASGDHVRFPSPSVLSVLLTYPFHQRGHIYLFDLHDPEATTSSLTSTEPTTTTTTTTHTPTLEYIAHD